MNQWLLELHTCGLYLSNWSNVMGSYFCKHSKPSRDQWDGSRCSLFDCEAGTPKADTANRLNRVYGTSLWCIDCPQAISVIPGSKPRAAWPMSTFGSQGGDLAKPYWYSRALDSTFRGEKLTPFVWKVESRFYVREYLELVCYQGNGRRTGTLKSIPNSTTVLLCLFFVWNSPENLNRSHSHTLCTQF